MRRLRLIFILFLNYCGLFAQDSLLVEGKHFGSFSSAAKLSLDPTGNIFLIDAGTNEILKLSDDDTVSQKVGGFGWSSQSFDHPHDVIAPNILDVYVADYGNHRIQRLDRNLNFISALYLRDSDDPNQRFGYPQSVAMDRFGSLYIVDGENSRVVKMSTATRFERTFGGMEAGKGRLHSPGRVRVSSSDLVYVQDENSIVVFDVFGNYLQTLGNGLFKSLRTFTLDQSTLYVLDSCTVLMFNERNTIIQRFELPFAESEGICQAVDLLVMGKKLLILTPKEAIMYLPFKEMNHEKKN